MSRTRAAPTPTNISTNSAPLVEKNATPASPATARASSVLPVPGGPTSRMPRGICAPSRPNSSGRLRKSTISCSSAFASSTPATSSNVVWMPVSAVISLARLRPIENSPPPRPPEAAPPAAAAAHHGARGPQPDADEQQRRDDPGHQRAQRIARRHAAEFDTVFGQRAGEVRRHLHRAELGVAVRHLLVQRAVQHVAGDGDLLHLPGVEILLELAVRNDAGAASPPPPPEPNRPSTVTTSNPRKISQMAAGNCGFGGGTRCLLCGCRHNGDGAPRNATNRRPRRCPAGPGSGAQRRFGASGPGSNSRIALSAERGLCQFANAGHSRLADFRPHMLLAGNAAGTDPCTPPD